MKESELVATIAARLLACDYQHGERVPESHVRAAVSTAYDILNWSRVESRKQFEARSAAVAARGGDFSLQA